MDAPERSGGSDSSQKRGDVHFGICGGYQMLGKQIADPHGVETGGVIREWDYFRSRQSWGTESANPGWRRDSWRMLDGCELSGYEIHIGISRPEGTANLSAGSATRLPGRSARTASLREMCAAPTCTAFLTMAQSPGRSCGTSQRGRDSCSGRTAWTTDCSRQQYDKLAATLRKYLISMRSIR